MDWHYYGDSYDRRKERNTLSKWSLVVLTLESNNLLLN